MKKIIVNEEAKKNNQTQLQTTGRNVEGEKKNIDNKAKNRKNAALKVSAQNQPPTQRRSRAAKEA